MMKLTLLCTTLLLPTVSLACSQMQPVAAFISINDKNHDNTLNLEEWMNAHAGENLVVSFKMNNEAEFHRLDVNHNGIVNALELGFESVKYKREPCADLQARFNRMNAARAFMSSQ